MTSTDISEAFHSDFLTITIFLQIHFGIFINSHLENESTVSQAVNPRLLIPRQNNKAGQDTVHHQTERPILHSYTLSLTFFERLTVV